MKNARRIRPLLFVAMFAVAFAALTSPAFAQKASVESSSASVIAPGRITQPIDESKLATLSRNTRPEANAKNDRGRVSDSWDADHMLMVLQRSPDKEQRLVRYIDSLNDRKSANFHHWLNAEELGDKYGVAQKDIDTITGWLQSHGFRVNKVFASRMMIDFSGTAGSIRDAFHTEIHQLDVKGETHFSNMSDPQIPAALAPAVNGIFSLNDFRAEHMYKSAKDYTFAGCASSTTNPTEPGTCYAVTPQDNAVIYNLNPLWSAGISGQGQTIALIEDSNTYTTGTAETTDSDWSTYRSTFGLSGYSATYSTVHPGGCTDPGTNGDDGEAAIDVEMASSFAPSAAIELVSCASGSFTEGTALAIANLVNGSGPYPGVLSMSYGLCEAATGNGATAYFYNAFEQAAVEGISAFASSGDAGTGQCGNIFETSGSEYNVTSLAITGWGESPFNVSVGGTDFEDTYNSKTGQNGGAALSTYWNSTNSATYGSALSYVPEIPWNDACASTLIADVLNGTPFTDWVTYGTAGACNKSPGDSTTGYLVLGAGSGGASSCATGNGGSAETSAAASDTYCQGYPKPSYQSGSGLTPSQAVYGQPSDGVRDVPDVAMFASNGPWGHYETVCWSDPSQTSGGATSCSGAPSTWAGFGGTSVASPSMAGIQALINQQTGERWGNPNPVYYQIAQNQYGTAGGTFQGTNCNASTGNTGGCAFNDITQGDNDVACEDDGTTAESHCYKPSGTYGVNSTDTVASTTILTGGSGYTSAPTCIISGPSNSNPYLSPTGTTLYAGGTQATCTAAFNAGSTSATYTIKFTGSGATISADYPNFGFTIGGVTYTFVTSLTGAPANSVLLVTSGSTSTQETDNAKNLEAAINATSTECTTSPCFGTGTVANPLATATETTSTVTVTAKTAGYAGNFSVSLATADAVFDPLEVETITQTATGSGPGYVSSITVTAAGSGYAPQTPITFSGGGGSGALALANTNAGTASSSYQPAYGAAPGYDLATGLGSPNATTLTNTCNWYLPNGTYGMYSPSNSSTLTSNTQTFSWCIVPGATAYWVDIGSTAGGNNYYSSGNLGLVYSTSTNNLPTNGSTIYVTLYAYINGSWSPNAYTYTAFNAGSETAVLTTPPPSSTLSGSTVTFDWTAGTASPKEYWLDIGSSAGGNNYYSSGNLESATSATASGLPTNGTTVYATLYTLVSGTWTPNSYTYTAFSSASETAVLTTPAPSSTLSGSTVTFGWTAGTASPQEYWLDIGSSAGGNNYYSSGNLGSALSTTASGLPTNGSTVYVTLYTLISGSWVGNAYTYTAVNSSSGLAAMQSPTPGSTLSGTTVTFTWSSDSSATGYWVDIGSTAGNNDIYSSGDLGTATTTTVTTLPANGSTIYVSLYSYVGGQWENNPVTYTSGP
jgi:Pro-kumamolisin, activation domain